jgi:hypothetical protein
MAQPTKPFKASTGNWYTSALFDETCLHPSHTMRTIDPVFSLYQDRPGLINCQSTFVALRDPTGYKWAMAYLGDWRHWERLIGIPWFADAVDTWRNQLKLKLQSEALEKIQEIAGGDSSQALAAAKYIAEEGWNPKSNRGRPSKVEVTAEMKRLTQAAQVVSDDAARIGLKVINGDKG